MNLLHRITRPACHQVRRVLQAYLDGELDASDADFVAAHLEHCERCGIEAELYEQVKESLGRLRRPPDPDAMDRLRRFAADLPDRPRPPDGAPPRST